MSPVTPVRKNNLLALGGWAMAVLILSGVGFVFGKVNGVDKNQTNHNVDRYAHPGFEGQLATLERDVAKLDEKLSENSEDLHDIHFSVLEQGIILKQIQDTIDGNNR